MVGTFGRLAQRVPADSPIQRLVALDVYAGPTAGIAYADDSEVFYFELQAWDEQQVRRIFSLRHTPNRVSDAILDILVAIEPPRWPEWWLTHQASESERAKLDELISESGSVQYIILSTDLMKRIDYCRDLVSTPEMQTEATRLMERQPGSEVSDHPFDEWLQFLMGGHPPERFMG